MGREAITRRGALTGVAGVGLTLPVLAACGEEAPQSATDPTAPSSTTTPAPSTGASSSAPPQPPEGGPIRTADVPVGAGAIFPDDNVVITQPTKGDFRAFSSACTHQGCAVTGVTSGGISCPCHGSTFSIEDGSPLGGPANAPMAPREITVDGDTIELA